MKVTFLFALAASISSFSYGANILGIFHFPSPSHHILGSTLLKELARKGHNVTMISPYTQKEPVENYRDISIQELETGKEQYMSKMMKNFNKSSSFTKYFSMINGIGHFTESVYKHERVQELLQSDAQFDLVIAVWTYSEALLGIAHHYGAPLIAFSTKGATPSTNFVSNNPNPYAYVPCQLFPYSDRMSFLERTVNVFGSAFSDILAYYFAHYVQQDILLKYAPDAPPLVELLENVALVMQNAHYSVETARPYVPNTVQIGGFHVKEPNKLTEDLQEFLDSATEGVIFFSLGGNLKSADIQEEKKRQIIRALASVPQKVLWKWEDEDLPEKPSNVKLGKWLPQNDILGHPNVKAFVTHGGLLSTIEAVYHGVPIIGIPFFSDQKTNVEVCVASGYGIRLNYEQLNQETLTSALLEITHNPKYTENIKRRSLVMRDQPLKPLDNAVFWVEHILRQGGGSHLKTEGANLSWYQLLLIDVIAFVLTIVLAIFVIAYFIVKYSIQIISRVVKSIREQGKRQTSKQLKGSLTMKNMKQKTN